MAKRYRSRHSLENFISQLTVLLIVSIGISLFTKRPDSSLPAWFWAVVVLIGEIILLTLAYKGYENYKLQRAGISEIDKMTGEQFEEYLILLFQRLGYSVDHFSKSHRGNEYGADLIITKDGQKTVVQAKRYRLTEHVDNTAVEKLVAAKAMFNCDHALVVTNSSFTENARYAANKLNVELWGRNELIKNILTTFKITN